jgi:hypothetical protein
MSRTWPAGDAITVEVNAATGKPARVSVNGRALKVVQVRKRWQVDLDAWEAEGRVWRAYWRVLTSDHGLMDIYYDFLDQAWHLAEQYD